MTEGRHRLLHLATNTNAGVVAQCDCPYGQNHPLDQPYRSCFECGATFATEYVLVNAHLEWFKNQEHLDPKYHRTALPGDYYGENIYSCPNCTHDW